MANTTTFENLDLDECSENIAIQNLVDYATTLEDNSENLCFADANFGWVVPEGVPDADDVPMMRAWSDSGSENTDNSDNVFDTGHRIISVYFYFYAFGEEEGANIQAQRARFVRHFINHLSDPDVLAGFDQAHWRIDFDTNIVIDHTNALKRVADYITVQPPWYVTRIDIPVELFTDYLAVG